MQTETKWDVCLFVFVEQWERRLPNENALNEALWKWDTVEAIKSFQCMADLIHGVTWCKARNNRAVIKERDRIKLNKAVWKGCGGGEAVRLSSFSWISFWTIHYLFGFDIFSPFTQQCHGKLDFMKGAGVDDWIIKHTLNEKQKIKRNSTTMPVNANGFPHFTPE